MRAGATADKIRQIEAWQESALFADAERAAFAFAEGMTVTGRGVTDEVFAAVRAHFSEAQIVELAAAVALENFRSKFNTALGIEAQGFCSVAPA